MRYLASLSVKAIGLEKRKHLLERLLSCSLLPKHTVSLCSWPFSSRFPRKWVEVTSPNAMGCGIWDASRCLGVQFYESETEFCSMFFPLQLSGTNRSTHRCLSLVANSSDSFSKSLNLYSLSFSIFSVALGQQNPRLLVCHLLGPTMLSIVATIAFCTTGGYRTPPSSTLGKNTRWLVAG